MTDLQIVLVVSDGVWVATAMRDGQARYDGTGDDITLAVIDLAEQLQAVAEGQAEIEKAPTTGLVEGSNGTKQVLAALIEQAGGEMALTQAEIVAAPADPQIIVQQHRDRLRYTVGT